MLVGKDKRKGNFFLMRFQIDFFFPLFFCSKYQREALPFGKIEGLDISEFKSLLKNQFQKGKIL